MTAFRTSATNVTRYYSEGQWKGRKVMLGTSSGWPLCGAGEHDLRQMHHFGPDEYDYGPTGFLECVRCTGCCLEPGQWVRP